MSRGKVVVAGSMNCDLVLRVPALPRPGETISATGFETFVGGKGANQAIACARLGAEVTMLGRLGDDGFAAKIVSALEAAGVDTGHLVVDPELPTGVADIRVDDRGENSICVAPLANGRFCARDIAAHDAAFDACTLLLLQLETPVEASIAAATAAKRRGAIVVLNPAPAPVEGLEPAFARLVDVLILNQSEAATLSGMEKAEVMIERLLQQGFGEVILTLGAAGAVRGSAAGVEHTQPFRVAVVDTTGAGDAFCGAFAAATAGGLPSTVAMRWGCAAGALACTRLGAEPSLPKLDALSALLQTSEDR